MEILTTRFGPIQVEPQNRVEFPKGLVGVPHLKRFVLLNDPQTPRVVWLQSTRDPAWAFALVDPRSVAAAYQVRATPEQLQAIQVADSRDVDVFVTLNRTAQSFMANLQAPILINRRLALGLQLVLSDNQYPLRHVVSFGKDPAALRRSA